MAYLDSSYLADADDFRRRVQIALLTAAKDVMVEDNTVASHAERVVFAKKVLGDPEAQTSDVVKVVVTNPAIDATENKTGLGRYTTTASDSDIQFTINSLFNALAGVAK